MLRRILCGLLLSACSFSALAGYQWNGAGKINRLFIYPTYAMKSNVEVVVDDTNCGPGGVKKFLGEIAIHKSI